MTTHTHEAPYRLTPGNGELTLLLLHGAVGDAEELVPFARAVAPDATYVAARGTVEHGPARSFFPSPDNGVSDDRAAARAARLLRGYLEDVEETLGGFAGPVVVVGYSSGADAGAALLLRERGPLAGAVLLRPLLPPVVRTASELRGTSVLVRPGRRDPIGRPGAAEALTGALEGAGAHVTLEWTDAAHALTAGDAASTRTWLAALRDARNHPG